MLAANYSTVRDEFKKYCDSATEDMETIIVTRKNGENVVMMSEDQYNNLMENLYVRSDKKAYTRLMESIDQLKAGKASKRDLIDE
jgi:antitoxin YefM